METGDGLLSRVRIAGGRLQSHQLKMLASLAERWALPVLELTSRGNLQIRGLDAHGDAQVTAALIESKLAATPAAAEAVRNVLSTPAADLDANAVADPWPIARELDQALLCDTTLWSLPSKFRIVLDGGGVTSIAQQTADIRADAVVSAQGIRYRLALAGSAQSAQVLGDCPSEQLGALMLALVRCFMQLNHQLPQPVHRLADLLAVTGIEPFQHACGPLEHVSNLAKQSSSAALGAQPGWFGVAVPFGQLTTEAALKLAALVEQRGNGQLRITPRRQILLPEAGLEVASVLGALGLITTDGDPRLSVTACPGAPACRSGSTATRNDALVWARALPQLFDGELNVHVSGCGKGCARPRASPLTLVARNGHYDLILNDRADPLDENNRLLVSMMPAMVLQKLERLSESLIQQRRAGEQLRQVIERLGEDREWWRRQLESE